MDPGLPLPAAPPLLRRTRAIRGAAAVLLPFDDDGAIDWDGFEAHLVRIGTAGLLPAVNMDTGFAPVLTAAQRAEVLQVTRGAFGSGFIAGVLVDDHPGAAFDVEATRRGVAEVTTAGGVPILFPSFGLAGLGEADVVAALDAGTADCDAAFAFELGTMFHPAGRIFSLATFAELLELPQFIGCKHSSLQRGAELDRLALRDARRPGFSVMTGNDLAIDLVCYGSDYLLGLATFAPDAFAQRDAAWAAGDELGFLELNDLLQYLGQLSFRSPVPGYRHDAAMFLQLRGHLSSSTTHPSSPLRPEADRELLADILRRLEALLR